MADLSDEALEAVSQHCWSLESLALSLIPSMTGTGLLPLLKDPERAGRLRSLAIGMRKVYPTDITGYTHFSNKMLPYLLISKSMLSGRYLL